MGKRLLLRLRSEHEGRFFEEILIIFWKLESINFEGQSKIIQFWPVVMAG